MFHKVPQCSTKIHMLNRHPTSPPGHHDNADTSNAAAVDRTRERRNERRAGRRRSLSIGPRGPARASTADVRRARRQRRPRPVAPGARVRSRHSVSLRRADTSAASPLAGRRPTKEEGRRANAQEPPTPWEGGDGGARTRRGARDIVRRPRGGTRRSHATTRDAVALAVGRGLPSFRRRCGTGRGGRVLLSHCARGTRGSRTLRRRSTVNSAVGPRPGMGADRVRSGSRKLAPMPPATMDADRPQKSPQPNRRKTMSKTKTVPPRRGSPSRGKGPPGRRRRSTGSRV